MVNKFVEYEDGSHTGIVPKTHKDYRAWVYNKIDGEMQSRIVTAPEATKLYIDGWRMSPAEFTDNPDLQDSPEFAAIADDMAQVLNTLLNIDMIDDIVVLKEFATGFFKMNVSSKATVKSLRKRIITAANKQGLYE